LLQLQRVERPGPSDTSDAAVSRRAAARAALAQYLKASDENGKCSPGDRQVDASASHALGA
jgi:hypothetical protein